MSQYNSCSSSKFMNKKHLRNSKCHHENLKCCGLGGCGPHGCRCFCGVSCHGTLCNCRPEYRYFLCRPEPQYPYTQPDYDGAAGGLGPCDCCGRSLPQKNKLKSCGRRQAARGDGSGCGGITRGRGRSNNNRGWGGGVRSNFPPGRSCTTGDELTGCEARKKYFTRIPQPMSCEDAEEHCSQFCLGDLLQQKFLLAKQREMGRRGVNRKFPGISGKSEC